MTEAIDQAVLDAVGEDVVEQPVEEAKEEVVEKPAKIKSSRKPRGKSNTDAPKKNKDGFVIGQQLTFEEIIAFERKQKKK